MWGHLTLPPPGEACQAYPRSHQRYNWERLLGTPCFKIPVGRNLVSFDFVLSASCRWHKEGAQKYLLRKTNGRRGRSHTTERRNGLLFCMGFSYFHLYFYFFQPQSLIHSTHTQCLLCARHWAGQCSYEDKADSCHQTSQMTLRRQQWQAFTEWKRGEGARGLSKVRLNSFLCVHSVAGRAETSLDLNSQV